MRKCIPCLLVLMAIGICSAKDLKPAALSLKISDSRFRLIRDVRYSGRDFSELAVQAGMFKKGSAYFPKAERGAAFADGQTWHGSGGIGLVAYQPQMKRYAIYYLQEQAVPGHHLDLVYSDKDYIFFAYGYHKNLPQIRPALEVYSIRHRCFVRIDAISTKGGKFGYYASHLWSKLHPGQPGAAMGWDDRAYSKKEWIPSRTGWPEDIKLHNGVFKLSYHLSWDIEEFVTTIQFTKTDLDRELNRIAPAKPADDLFNIPKKPVEIRPTVPAE